MKNDTPNVVVASPPIKLNLEKIGITHKKLTNNLVGITIFMNLYENECKENINLRKQLGCVLDSLSQYKKSKLVSWFCTFSGICISVCIALLTNLIVKDKTNLYLHIILLAFLILADVLVVLLPNVFLTTIKNIIHVKDE